MTVFAAVYSIQLGVYLCRVRVWTVVCIGASAFVVFSCRYMSANSKDLFSSGSYVDQASAGFTPADVPL